MPKKIEGLNELYDNRYVFFMKILFQPSTVEEVIKPQQLSFTELSLPWWALGGGLSGVVVSVIMLAVFNLALTQSDSDPV